MSKITCHFKKTTDIIVPDIETIRKKPNRRLRYANFVNQYWSEQDIEHIIRGYTRVRLGQVTIAEMAAEIGKTRSSTRNKAWRMGISAIK